jgi:tyrosinase
MAAVRVRRDVWELGDENDPWRDPVIVNYARAVQAMMDLAASDPAHEANWINQAAIHERRDVSVAGRLEDQCQHASWFFLPWHRLYLYFFEEIIRSHLPAEVAADWALPYWNYSDDPAHAVLPPAFRVADWPDGADNPLFTAARATWPIDINGGDALDPALVATDAALSPPTFSRPHGQPGFGGGETSPRFHHGTDGIGTGPLEGTPHGTVHTAVGGVQRRGPDGHMHQDLGLMSLFGTAALDPIFWLHHANLDRLWEKWRRDPLPGHNPGVNSSEPTWLTMKFELVKPDGTRQKMAVGEALDIEQQLGYTYSGLPAEPPPGPEGIAEDMAPEPGPPKIVGATEETITLEGATESTAFAVEAPAGAGGAGIAGPEAVGAPRTYLNVERIKGSSNPGLVYGVYVNLPEGEKPDPKSPHYAGALPFFGIESTVPDDADEEAAHDLHYQLDITPTVAALTERDRWDPAHLHVTFSPIGIDDGDEKGRDIPPVEIGRVSLAVE